MATQEQEAQELTDKVLNIRYALEKLNKQKQDTETALKTLTQEKDELEKTNKWYLEANKTFEEKLASLNNQILAKQNELEQAQWVYKEEIDKKFKIIETRTIELNNKEKDISNREDNIMRDEARQIEAQKNVESAVLQAEHMEKQNAVKEVELNRTKQNQDTYQEVLKQKEDQLGQKEAHLTLFDKSLLERESTLIGKLNKLTEMEVQLVQLKNAIDNDRVNLENEKNSSSYVLRALNEVQTRCITNVGQQITEDMIKKIRESVTNIMDPVTTEPSIVDRTVLYTAPVATPEVPEDVVTNEVVETPTEEEKQQEPAQYDKEINKTGMWEPNETTPEDVPPTEEAKPVKKVAKRKITFKTKK